MNESMMRQKSRKIFFVILTQIRIDYDVNQLDKANK